MIIDNAGYSSYHIQPGDTLSGIATAHRVQGGYSALAVLNDLPDPDLIVAGRYLKIPQASSSTSSTPSHPTLQPGTGRHRGTGSNSDKTPLRAAAPAAPSRTAPSRTAPGTSRSATRSAVKPRSGSTSHSTSGYSGMQLCIVQHESGGNPQIWNPTGHWGLYQYDRSTWIESGGSASSFGNASAAEQNRIFQRTVAMRGYQPWTGDGCV